MGGRGGAGGALGATSEQRRIMGNMRAAISKKRTSNSTNF